MKSDIELVNLRTLRIGCSDNDLLKFALHAPNIRNITMWSRMWWIDNMIFMSTETIIDLFAHNRYLTYFGFSSSNDQLLHSSEDENFTNQLITATLKRAEFSIKMFLNGATMNIEKVKIGNAADIVVNIHSFRFAEPPLLKCRLYMGRNLWTALSFSIYHESTLLPGTRCHFKWGKGQTF